MVHQSLVQTIGFSNAAICKISSRHTVLYILFYIHTILLFLSLLFSLQQHFCLLCFLPVYRLSHSRPAYILSSVFSIRHTQAYCLSCLIWIRCHSLHSNIPFHTTLPRQRLWRCIQCWYVTRQAASTGVQHRRLRQVRSTLDMHAFRGRTWRVFRLVRAATYCEFRTIFEQTLFIVDV